MKQNAEDYNLNFLHHSKEIIMNEDQLLYIYTVKL